MNYELAFLVLAVVYVVTFAAWTVFSGLKLRLDLQNLRRCIRTHDLTAQKLEMYINRFGGVSPEDWQRIQTLQYQVDEQRLDEHLRWGKKEQTK
jgi:hypothetical protein